jgi:hypothetical protein
LRSQKGNSREERWNVNFKKKKTVHIHAIPHIICEHKEEGRGHIVYIRQKETKTRKKLIFIIQCASVDSAMSEF